MHPRKSDAGKAAVVVVEEPASPDPQSEDDRPKGKAKERESVSIDDNTLPKTLITRLAKGTPGVPNNTQIQKDAVTALTRSATVFVNHLASAANDITKSNNKKTIMPKDVIEALDAIEFPGFRERLEAELEIFTKAQQEKRSKAKARTNVAANTTEDAISEDEANARPLKRQRKSLAQGDKDDDGKDGGAIEGNILEGGSGEGEEEEEEGEDGEEDEEGEEEEGQEESGEEEEAVELEDRVEDIGGGGDEEVEEEDEMSDDDSD